MSIALMTQAWKSKFGSTAKMVLLALCDNANDQGECFPSVSMLAEKCSLSERAVFKQLDLLEEVGAIKRNGRTGRSTVYVLDTSKFGLSEGDKHYVYQITDDSTSQFYLGVRTCVGEIDSDGYMGSGAWFNDRVSNGSALKKSILKTFKSRQEAEDFESLLIEMHRTNLLCMNRKTPARSSSCTTDTLNVVHPTPERGSPTPLNYVQSTPERGSPITISNHQIEPSSNRKTGDLLSEIPSDLASDFMQLRKSKKQALTATAVNGIRREAQKAGISFEDAIRACCEYGWGGFNAGWYAERNGTAKQPAEPTWRTEQRNRTIQAVPAIAQVHQSATDFFDVEAKNVTAITLGR